MAADPNILEAQGVVPPITLATGVVAKPGDLLGYSSGWKLADADGRIKAELIAMEYGDGDGGKGPTAIHACRACLLEDTDAPYTAGNVLWLSETAGAHTATRPTIDTTLTYHQKVGRAITTSLVLLDCGLGNDPPMLVQAALNPASLAAATSVEEAITITGLATTDRVVAHVPASLENDLVLSGLRVSAANTLQLRLSNIDNTNAVDGASLTWEFLVLRGGAD